MDLSLSTVSIAMKYGTRTDSTGVAHLLDSARDAGIPAVDTSGAYGEAEKIVGGYLSNVPEKPFEVTIKIRPGALFNVSPADYYTTLRQHAAGSLNNLKIKSADVCMFHNAEYINDKEALNALRRLKEEKLVKKTGIVTSLPTEFEAADQTPEFDIICIPYNILDTRLDGMLKRTDKEIYARGAFLNGALLADADDVPEKLAAIKPYLRVIDRFCAYHGMNRLSVILGFIKTQPKIDRLVFGVDNIWQLGEVTRSFDSEYDSTALRELVEEFAGVADSVIMPSLWHGEYR